MKLFRPAAPTISDEAADWLLRIENPDYDPSDPYPDPLDRRRHFFDWVRQSPQHLKEFLELHETYRKLALVDPQRLIDVGAMPQPQNEKIVPLFRDDDDVRMSFGGRSARKLGSAVSWGGLAWVLVLAGALLAGYWRYVGGSASWKRYATVIGEQQSSKLDDGSVVILNTDSLVEVSFTPVRRNLRLLRGEALFLVEKDPQRRPFVVDAGNVAVRATGTQFDIYRRNQTTDVAVIEGAVQIAPDAQDRARVNAGERARVATGQTTITRNVNIAAMVAWRERRLVFEDEPLANVVTELNRYNRNKVVLADGVGQDVRVTAKFQNDKVQSLLRYLDDQSDLEARPEGDNWVIRKR
jgi:transmembrane sensor